MVEVLAILIILIDILLLLRNRNNPYLLIFNFLILYFNYSICFGSYIFRKNRLESLLSTYEDGELYFLGIALLFIFSLLRLILFYKKIEVSKEVKGHSYFLYFISVLILFYISVFEIDRELSQSYEVKISPLYEYSFIFVMLAFYYLPEKFLTKIILYSIVLILIMQDFYYGGRVTSLQILIVVALMRFKNFIKLKYILLPFFILNTVFTTVGIYRDSYRLDMGIGDVFSMLIENLFISNTVVYAYFASITHLFTYEKIDWLFSMESFVCFILMVFIGGIGSSLFGLDLSKANVTEIANGYHWNVGGGIIITYIYFWFGPYFYTIVILVILIYIRKKIKFVNKKQYFTLILILISLPRWYLYNPLALFRGVFFMLPVILFIYKIIQKFSNEKLHQNYNN